MEQKHLTKISKLLSLALRHKPEALSITLDDKGWARVSDVLKGLVSKGYKCSRDDLNTVVSENDKKRFAISEDGTKIRASQGHSISIDLGLICCEPPEKLFHGTSSHSTSAIYSSGLQKMSRQHVHLSTNLETAQKVGSRHGGKLVVFEIMTAPMRAAGHVFYQSENGVWLTDSVPVQFLSVVYRED